MTKRKTASELIAEMDSDPAYQKRAAVREERLTAFAAEFAHEEEEISREAATVGYQIESVWDFVNNTPHLVLKRAFSGPYDRAYPMLVKHLRSPHHARVREGIIRALTVKDGGALVKDALLEAFQSEDNPGLKWVLANALRQAMPLKERKGHPDIETVYRGHSTGAL